MWNYSTINIISNGQCSQFERYTYTNERKHAVQCDNQLHLVKNIFHFWNLLKKAS